MADAALADVVLEGVEVPADRAIGPPGIGFSHVAAAALTSGRFTVAAGCAGLALACLTEAVAHARTRQQFGVAIGEHQLVRRLLARTAVAARSAEQWTGWAAAGLDQRSDDAVERTFLAKYAAARAAEEAADCAVQVLGSRAFRPGARVGRLAADARVMRVIEGTDEICEDVIGGALLRSFREERT